MEREALVQKLTAIVADTLDRPAADVGPFDSLIADLGAESIDFLDLQFRIESAFGLKLGEEELWRGAFDPEDERFVRGGRLTEAALAELVRRQPGFRWERFPSGIAAADLPQLITVDSIAAHLERRLAPDSSEPAKAPAPQERSA